MRTLVSLLFIMCLSAVANDSKPVKTKVRFAGFDLVRYETERVIILAEDGQEEKYAKNYEAVWQLVEQLIPETMKKFPASKKNYVIVLKNEYNYMKYGKWTIKHRRRMSHIDKICHQHSWERENAILNSLNREQKLEPAGLDYEKNLGFAACTPEKFVGDYSPVLTNFFAQSIFWALFADLRSSFPNVYASGFGYYCEHALCKGIYTTDYASKKDLRRMKKALTREEITCSELVTKSHNWPAVIKDILQTNKYPYSPDASNSGTSDIETSIHIGFAFGLVYYMIHNKFRQGSYDQFLLKLVKGVRPNVAVYSTFGFKDEKDFEKRWKNYMKSDRFK